MTRRKFTTKFKTQVVLETLKERQSLAELGQKFDLHPNQITKWKQEFLARAETVFKESAASKQTEAEEREAKLLKTIGRLKVENDFLKDALR